MDEQPAGAPCQGPGPRTRPGGSGCGVCSLGCHARKPLSPRVLAQSWGAPLSVPGLCDSPSPFRHTNNSRSNNNKLKSVPKQAPHLHSVNHPG